MTSEQVLLIAATLLLCACDIPQLPAKPADPLLSPYRERRIWAVAPLRNESGTMTADTVAVADHLARQLENASNIDMLPVNRVLAAMESLQMSQVSGRADAMKLLGVLGCDGLIAGTLTSYDPYEPPKIGMAIELYTSNRVERIEAVDLRQMSRAGTGPQTQPASAPPRQPVSAVSTYFDAKDPDVQKMLERYAAKRGLSENDRIKDQSHLYRISMDLFTEFATYVVSWRLLKAEETRLTPPAPASSR
jgi:hypothetical protein